MCTITQKVFVLGSSCLDIWCVRMTSRTYQILVVVTSISRSQGVIMCEKLLCVHNNSNNICARLFLLGYNVYRDGISYVSKFGGGDLNFKVAGGHYA